MHKLFLILTWKNSKGFFRIFHCLLFRDAIEAEPSIYDASHLDTLAAKGNPRALIHAILLISSVSPQRALECFGLETLVWTWINRDGAVTPPEDVRDYDTKEKLRTLLSDQNLNLALVDALAAATAVSSGVRSVEATICLYRAHNNCAEKPSNPATAQGDSSEKVLSIHLSNCLQVNWQRHDVPQYRRVAESQLLALASRHLPEDLSQESLRLLSLDPVKNPEFLRVLLGKIEPAVIHEEFGSESGRDLLLWAVVNNTSQDDPALNYPCTDFSARAILEYLRLNWDIDIPLLEQARSADYFLGNGSVDFQSVYQNYRLLVEHRRLRSSDIPLMDILKRNALGRINESKWARFSVDILNVPPPEFQGKEGKWSRINLMQDGYERQFSNTVGLDTPSGMALLHDNFPIAIVSYMAGMVDNTPHFRITQLQGIPVELWKDHEMTLKPTPRVLWRNFRDVLADMALVLADKLEMPWTIQSADQSRYHRKLANEPLSKMNVRGAPLRRDLATGDYRPERPELE
ncbi:MAG: hypothetical protein KDD42_00700 [Bdellovibrionales bacterium]|nr:hypothetical protein [Bdellovibrionales bacterium]